MLTSNNNEKEDNESKARRMIDFINEKENEFRNDDSISSFQAIHEIYGFFGRLSAPSIYRIDVSEYINSFDKSKHLEMIIKKLPITIEISLEGSYLNNNNVNLNMIDNFIIKKIYYGRYKLLEKLAKTHGWNP
jgi:hypothetical protein